MTYLPAEETSPSFVKWSRLLEQVWQNNRMRHIQLHLEKMLSITDVVACGIMLTC